MSLLTLLKQRGACDLTVCRVVLCKPVPTCHASLSWRGGPSQTPPSGGPRPRQPAPPSPEAWLCRGGAAMLSSIARARLFAPPQEAEEIDQALAAMRSFRRVLRRISAATPPFRARRRGTPGARRGAGGRSASLAPEPTGALLAQAACSACARVRVRAPRTCPALISRLARSLDLLMARRLLQSWDDGAGVPRLVRYGGAGGRHAGAFSSFAHGQLRLQAFDAPPSWAAAAGGEGGDGSDGDQEPPCAVCLEPVLTGRVVAGPACLHRLHEACALQLAASAAAAAVVCPTCRAPLLAVHCRAPGEARHCAGGEDETEDEDDDGEEVVAARGITAQVRPTARPQLLLLYIVLCTRGVYADACCGAPRRHAGSRAAAAAAAASGAQRGAAAHLVWPSGAGTRGEQRRRRG